MKKIIFVLFITYFFVLNNVIAQTQNDKSIIGVWQKRDALVAAGLNDTYRFYPDGKFSFEPSTFNYLSRVREIIGTYFVKDSILALKITKYVVYENGKLIYGDNDYWEFENESERTINVDKKEQEEYDATINYIKKDVLKINVTKYYKLSSNPDKYKD
jgi:hypothetical protein